MRSSLVFLGPRIESAATEEAAVFNSVHQTNVKCLQYLRSEHTDWTRETLSVPSQSLQFSKDTKKKKKKKNKKKKNCGNDYIKKKGKKKKKKAEMENNGDRDGVEPSAYGGSQARGWIGATAAGLSHSHSNVGSKPHPQPTPQLTATPDPQPTEQAQGLNPHPHSQVR